VTEVLVFFQWYLFITVITRRYEPSAIRRSWRRTNNQSLADLKSCFRSAAAIRVRSQSEGVVEIPTRDPARGN